MTFEKVTSSPQLYFSNIKNEWCWSRDGEIWITKAVMMVFRLFFVLLTFNLGDPGAILNQEHCQDYRTGKCTYMTITPQNNITFQHYGRLGLFSLCMLSFIFNGNTYMPFLGIFFFLKFAQCVVIYNTQYNVFGSLFSQSETSGTGALLRFWARQKDLLLILPLTQEVIPCYCTIQVEPALSTPLIWDSN